MAIDCVDDLNFVTDVSKGAGIKLKIRTPILSIKATSPYRYPEQKDKAIWTFGAEYVVVFHELSGSLIFSLMSFSGSTRQEMQ